MKTMEQAMSDFIEIEMDDGDAVMENITEEQCVPTGCTPLNLALTNIANGGFMKGSVTNIVGINSAGKTMLVLASLAECANNPKWDNYRLRYRDAERTMKNINMGLFGKLKDRLEDAYEGLDEDITSTDTMELLHADIEDLLKEGDPFVYVVDSLDSISSMEEIARTKKNIANIKKGKKSDGSYKMERAKAMSEMFRQVTGRIEASGSILLILSQVRANMNQFSKAVHDRAGGHALDHYASCIMWLKAKMRLKKGTRDVGTLTEITVSKNKFTGNRRKTEMVIYNDYGLDDITSMALLLLDEKKWKIAKDANPMAPATKFIIKKSIGEDFKYSGTVRDFGAWMETQRPREIKKLISLCEKAWQEAEERASTKRSRY